MTGIVKRIDRYSCVTNIIGCLHRSQLPCTAGEKCLYRTLRTFLTGIDDQDYDQGEKK
jgi:hypothetical protein